MAIQKTSSVSVSNQLYPGSSVVLKKDSRTIKDDFSSGRRRNYIVNETEYFSSDEAGYDIVEVEKKASESPAYKSQLQNIVVVKSKLV